MSESRNEWKVGLFVVITLVLVAALVLIFSKGVSPLRATYEIRLRTTDVGGIKTRAGVLMAGVQIGSVVDMDLAPDGRSVVLRLRIEDRYRLSRDARFMIEQSGLLGDQFVAIVPGPPGGEPLRDGDEVLTEPSTDFKVMLRSAAGLIDRLDDIASSLQSAARRIDQSLLSEANVAAISTTATNLQLLSVKAGATIERVDRLVEQNTDRLTTAMTDLTDFSRDMKRLAADLRQVVATNADEVSRLLGHVESATATANELLSDLKNGSGLLGGLLRDDQLRHEGGILLSNLAGASANLVQLSSNLNRYGIFYKPRQPLSPPPSLYPGRTPFR
jgi:phospholipid/cholesterol/gamma-HCH transport system substrate-binding protein